MNNDQKSGFRTLLLSVLLSAPGPLILGIGLTVGKSSTQISDFVRRTAELLALIISCVIYYRTNTDKRPVSEQEKQNLERQGNTFVGVIMCISGLSMILVTLIQESTDKGNVVPALIIALLGDTANTLFWQKYKALYKKQGNAVLGVQSRLYRAKSCVDIVVTIALASILLFPKSSISYYLDIIGSILVSVYMMYCGIRTVKEAQTKTHNA